MTNTPQPLQIDLLSFSAWQRGLTCPLALAFERDRAHTRWQRSTPASALGQVRHQLEEDVTRGHADGSALPGAEWVRQRWAALIEQARQGLAEDWAPATVARPESWDGFYATLAALSRSLGEEIERRRAGLGGADARAERLRGTPPASQQVPPPSPGHADSARVETSHLALARAPELERGQQPDASGNPAAPPRPGEPYSEVTLVDATNHLVGRIDHIEARDGALAVVDYKSFGRTGAAADERTRSQLLFYAGLVEATWGIWPSLAVSRPGSVGEPLAYTPADALAVRASAAQFRPAWNAATDLSSIAATPKRCQWCDFQAICPVFRTTFPPDMNDDPRRVRAHSLAAGAVLTVRRMGDRETRVTIIQDRDLTCPAGEVSIARLPARLGVAEGDQISVARVDRGGGAATVRAAWNSLVDVTGRSAPFWLDQGDGPTKRRDRR